MSDHKDRKMEDFSQKAVRSQVLRTAVQHPAVLYPGLVGLLGGVSAVVLEPSLLAVATAVGGLGVAGLSWLAGLSVFRNYFANAYVRKLYEQIEKRRSERIVETKKRLEEVDSREGLHQFERLQDKFSIFRQLLTSKLRAGELTYTRYLGMGEQVYLAVLDNLNDMANMIQSVNAIDRGFLDKRVNDLKVAGGDAAHVEELAALEQRMQLFEQQKERIHQLLSENEQAMTKLDLTVSAITELKTGEKHAKLDLETAMAELQRLAERTQSYNE